LCKAKDLPCHRVDYDRAMGDTSPRNQRALQHDAPKAPTRQPQPGELLFEFHVERTHRFYRAEVRDRGEWDVEAQILNHARTVGPTAST
jgi:hypothetical protein